MNLEEYHLVDTHAHICDEIFDSDRSEVIAQAKEAGIVQIVAVGENLEDARKNLNLIDIHKELVCAAGLYPTFLDLGQAQEMRQFIRDHKGMIGAIGEVGLDFWKVQDKEDQQRQQEIFSGFIGLSLELGLPLNVHSRSAGREAIWFLLDHGADKVQMHAFDAKATSALPGVEAGFFFSIPPSVVRSRQKQKLVKKLPLEALLLETDSPVLGPEPHSRNVPANALVSAKAIAEIKQVPLQEVLEMVTENFKCLYRA
jgi:TatD DNase family protein